MAPRVRKPTGRPSWPLILVEGEEKAGKSWAAAELSASPKVGQTYWLDIREGTADEYGAVPGARYLIIDHDGTWPDIVRQVEEVRQVAAAADEAGEPPVVLVIDSMTELWESLKEIGDRMARRRAAKKGRHAPEGEEVVIDRDIWNVINARHRRLMTTLMTFPGIVVGIARGKVVTAVDDNGNPIPGRRDYKVEGQKNVAYDASAWVRMRRDGPPMVVGLRSVHAGVRPGVDEPVITPDFSLEWLVFEVMRCQPGQSQARDLRSAAGEERTADEIAAEALEPGTTVERLRELAREADILGLGDVTVSDRSGNTGPLRNLITYLGRSRAAQPAPAADGRATEAHHRRMHALWREAQDFEDRDARLAFTREIIGRHIESSSELTAAEAEKVVETLQRYIAKNTPPADDAEPAAAAAVEGVGV